MPSSTPPLQQLAASPTDVDYRSGSISVSSSDTSSSLSTSSPVSVISNEINTDEKKDNTIIKNTDDTKNWSADESLNNLNAIDQITDEELKILVEMERANK